jgi:hypothetical protein
LRTLILAGVAAVALALSVGQASAWYRGGFGGSWGHTAGGVYHTSDVGGFEHGTYAGAGGVAHAGDAGGYWHGSAANGYGAYHGSTYGGYYHGTYANGYGAYHTGAYGDYYHQPVVGASYGCYGCGYSGWGYAGAAASGAVAAAAVGAAAVAATTPAVVAPAAPVVAASWPIGVTYGYLPAGCAYEHFPLRGAFYRCPAGWLRPAYGANGVYYTVVGAPI